MNNPRSSDEWGWSLRKPHSGATWGGRMAEWKDLGEVSRGQQDKYRSILLKEKENCHGQAFAP